jgi:hypothetical protein
MRDVYYQSAGNPVQADRLPETLPELSLLPREASLDGSFQNAAQGLFLSGLFVVLPLIFYRVPGWSWLTPYDLLFALPVITYFVGSWLQTQQVCHLLHPAFLLALVLVFINHRTPWALQIAIVAFGVALFIYAFGRHWTVVCTASPVPRALAEQVQTTCQENLYLLAALAASGIAIVLWLSSPVAKLLFFALPLAAILLPLPQGFSESRWQVLRESLGSWFQYRSASVPGLLQSPVGDSRERWAGAIFISVLTALVCLRWEGSPLPDVIAWGLERHQTIGEHSAANGATRFETMRNLSLIWLLTITAILTLPPLVAWLITLSASMPVLLYAAAHRNREATGSQVAGILANIRESKDPTERSSIYLGRVVSDGSPVLVPRRIFEEHAHGLGDSGSGKTSLFLCPIIEQLVMAGDCSVIVLDFKADTLELLATLQCAAEQRARSGGSRPSLKVFSNQRNKHTFAFNPMAQPFWKDFDLLTRTDILCSASGLNYGPGYGRDFFGSANGAVVYHTLKTFPNSDTFAELSECIGHVMMSAKKRDLNPEIRKAGVHVHEVFKRLAACAPLNVTGRTGHAPEVVAQAIDLTQVFLDPHLLYFHLPATLSPSGAPEIGRIVNYLLLAAATQTERKVPVFLVIDEFQRMVADNLEYMLQLARSMGVGVILANQSMEDLKKGGSNLIPAIEANCRLRQWFSVSSSDDQQRLIRLSGETVDIKASITRSENHEGQVTHSESLSEVVVPRITIDDVLLTSDHPFRSFLRISRSAGYAQYGGMPVIIESEYHISEDEYRRRKALPWPILPGSFLPSDDPSGGAEKGALLPSPGPSGPEWTNEVIGESPLSAADEAALGELFASFEAQAPQTPQMPRKRGRKQS